MLAPELIESKKSAFLCQAQFHRSLTLGAKTWCYDFSPMRKNAERKFTESCNIKDEDMGNVDHSSRNSSSGYCGLVRLV